ncbi:MAG: PilT/PilU family type 4a pilus ATPase [Candidatus Omnitrophica bacterium]|nr:PilT/PilU family type 4a pilus ATPase [Candidatus Omnitrophota bacterium]MBU1933201.1 PilT/PilU family type 4a pilus ATPase [Candidatus Omnitrophota bacterium]
MNLDSILRSMMERKASDLILKVGSPVCLRVNGELFKEGSILGEDDLMLLFEQVLGRSSGREIKKGKEAVLSFGIKDVGRFRATVFQQKGTLAIVVRSVNTYIPDFKTLNLPSNILEDLCNEKRGLVLITGTTGSGKSTTVASMIEHVNREKARHIITLEDPIEFMYEDKKSIISQREVKIDTESFQEALEFIMLQTPDIIFIGDIRNSEVMSTVLTAAETGQLVIANLHTINTTHTVERIVNFFQPHQHDEIRMRLSLLLRGILSLRLVPLKDGSGRIPACEILISTPTIAELIREGKLDEIEYYIKDGSLYGMQTFDQTLLELCKKDLITKDTAISYAERKNELMMNLRDLR